MPFGHLQILGINDTGAIGIVVLSLVDLSLATLPLALINHLLFLQLSNDVVDKVDDINFEVPGGLLAGDQQIFRLEHMV